MVRPAVRVRPATPADLPVLVAFGTELREHLLPVAEPSARARATAAQLSSLEERYRDALADPSRSVVVAVGPSNEVLGVALLVVAATNALLDVPAVHMSHVLVSDRHTRRGAGKALVAEAAAFAEERGLDQVVVSVGHGWRESNRFFARLGFAPFAVRRVAPVALLRKNLGQDGRPAEPALRRRSRRLRPRATAALPLGPARAADTDPDEEPALLPTQSTSPSAPAVAPALEATRKAAAQA